MVFRGSVVERPVLPQRTEMKGRGRYAIFHVDEHWKGIPGRTVILYGVDDGTDCLGDGGYEVGKNYLVYASEPDVADGFAEGSCYGWTDLLPKRSKILVPQTACMPRGNICGAEVAADLERTMPHERIVREIGDIVSWRMLSRRTVLLAPLAAPLA